MILLLGGASATPSLVEAAGARFEVPVVAVPRVGDVLAGQAAHAAPDLKGIVSDVEYATAPRGAVPAPAPTAGDDSSPAAALARARRRWTPMVPLTAVPAVASTTSGPQGIAPLTTRPTAAPSNPAPRPGSSTLPAAFARPGARLARIPVARPTHLAMAAAVLITVAAVPAIGGAMQNIDDPATAAAPGSAIAAVAGAAGGLFGGAGLGFTPGKAGAAGPSVSQWLANPSGTLGPNQLLSMSRPAAAGSSPSSMPSTAGGGPAAVAAGTASAAAAAPAGSSTPASGSTPAGAATPAGTSGSTPASTSPPANPPASNPPASDPPSNPPASDPPASDPPSNPPASDPPSNPPASDPPVSDPSPSNEPGPQSTPDPVPSSAESTPVADATLAADDSGSGSGGGSGSADGADGSTTP
jgi:hypothetical protein